MIMILDTMRRAQGWQGLVVACLAMALALPAPAGAAVAASPVNTYTVTNTNDSGSGSLRLAINNANNSPGADTINFTIGTGAQTITPLSALPTLTGPVTIDG